MLTEGRENPQTERKYLQNAYLINNWSPKYTKNSKIRRKKSIKKLDKILNRYLPKENMQMQSQYMKRCSVSYVVSELQNKTATRYHYTSIRWAEFQKTKLTPPNAGKAVEQEKLHTCWWE